MSVLEEKREDYDPMGFSGYGLYITYNQTINLETTATIKIIATFCHVLRDCSRGSNFM